MRLLPIFLSTFILFAPVVRGATDAPDADSTPYCGRVLLKDESPRWLRSPKLLMVGDFGSDGAEFIAELRRAGFEPRVTFVNDIDAPALKEKWNLVIVAEKAEQPRVESLARRLKKDRRRLPIVAWVGPSETERRNGLATIGKGASDVISTHDRTRWAPAVLRELESSYQRWKARKEARQRMLAREEEDILIDSADDLLLVGTRKGKPYRINPAFEKITGYTAKETMAMRSLFDGIPREEMPAIEALLAKLTPDDRLAKFESRYATKSGEYRVIAWTVTLLRTLGDLVFIHGRDVTYLNEHQVRRQHLVKMEAIGVLAAGVAHDINNGLTPILGFTELLRATLPADAPQQEHLSMVQQAASRLAELTGQILALGRSESHRKPVNLQPIVEEVLKFLRRSIPTSIEFEEDFDPRVKPVNVDSGQVHQVMLNLVTNAYHAIPNSLGTITIAIKDITLDAPVPSVLGDVPPGRYTKLSVADTGVGIPPEVLEKIFEPFFTTKEVGKGTGLGLSVVHGRVRDNGGYVAVQSEPGKGTKFQVYFPAIVAGGSFYGTLPTATPSKPATGTGKRLLVVDDEVAIRELQKILLLQLGYQVELAENGEQAFQKFSSKPGAYDLVITDLTMPRLSGRDLTQRIRDTGSKIPILLVTGALDQINPDDFAAAGVTEYFGKPLPRGTLLAALERYLSDEPQD